MPGARVAALAVCACRVCLLARCARGINVCEWWSYASVRHEAHVCSIARIYCFKQPLPWLCLPADSGFLLRSQVQSLRSAAAQAFRATCVSHLGSRHSLGFPCGCISDWSLLTSPFTVAMTHLCCPRLCCMSYSSGCVHGHW